MNLISVDIQIAIIVAVIAIICVVVNYRLNYFSIRSPFSVK